MTNKQLGFDKYKSLIEFQMKFRTDEICLEHLRMLRFPDGLVCPDCNCRKVYANRDGSLECSNRKCKKRFNVRTGTPFRLIKAPLTTWFAAIFLLNRGKIKESQLMKQLDITRGTAKSIIKSFRYNRSGKQYGKQPEKKDTQDDKKTLDERWREYQMWRKPLYKDPRRIT